ncbi:UbiA family prenyltransferase [Kitasatospora sp. NPDC093102]|uniref:UbiA family prenyltransferase n=1 Tax=Kitasatospora sp. NPDC093102 TaxID=3155069 RepID=UPI003412BFAD
MFTAQSPLADRDRDDGQAYRERRAVRAGGGAGRPAPLPAPLPATLAGRIRFEVRVTIRLLADNSSAAVVPPVLFTAAVGLRQGLAAADLARHVAAAAVLFLLFLYVFDTANQAAGAAEDALNKPYRPIPSGLITREGVLTRLSIALPLYTLAGLLTETIGWVLLWQTVSLGLNLLSNPRHYVVVKPVAMVLGTLAQLAAAWELVTPLDGEGWRWVLVVTAACNLPMCFEDVRDMAGDRRIGRRTLPLMLGHWPVRIWFALNMAALPATLHVLLFSHGHAGQAVVLGCDALVAVPAWTAGARSLLRREARADRVTYLLFTGIYAVILSCAFALL